MWSYVVIEVVDVIVEYLVWYFGGDFGGVDV